ncbi:DUF2291 family protein [Phaeobacter sp. B1627]|uniref:DUF2291 family protein n=1 Tax=Phaeobacter sp. B1627 TaxID=2583809 RepID=UPI00111ADE19|nr:DUF2291 domain-containing protein [Phaeobacter sp. B1627]TNJ39948.1 DUF2291 domain-containing protein [Phaeobacter sp. B1627]
MRDCLKSLAVLSCVALLPVACKVVKTPDPEAASAVAQTDEARMAVYAADIWDAKVLPMAKESAVPLQELKAEIAANGLDAVGNAYGLRPEGEANPWNFVSSGEGVIIEANTQSRAAKLAVDIDGNGAADLVVQLGPVVRGTALRDAMPFIIFSDFRDQIEFAKLARALNDLASQSVTLPEGDLVGRRVEFEGVYTLRNAGDAIELVPTKLQVH